MADDAAALPSASTPPALADPASAPSSLHAEAWRPRHLPFGSGLMRIVVTYAAGALVVLGIARRTQVTGLLAVVAAGATGVLIPLLVRPSMREQVRWRLRPLAAAALPLLVGSTAIATAAGALGVGSSGAASEGAAVDAQMLGPVDVVVEAPDGAARSAAAVALTAALRSASNRGLSDADPLAFDLLTATTLDGRSVTLLALPVEPAAAFGGRPEETGLPARSLRAGDALSVGAALRPGPVEVRVGPDAGPLVLEVVGRVPGGGIPGLGAVLDDAAAAAPRAGTVIVDPTTLDALEGRITGRRYLLGLTATGSARDGRLLAGELRRVAQRVTERDEVRTEPSVPASAEAPGVTAAQPVPAPDDSGDVFIIPDPGVLVTGEPDPDPVVQPAGVAAPGRQFAVTDMRATLSDRVARDDLRSSKLRSTMILGSLPALLIALVVLALGAVDGDRRTTASVHLAGLLPWRAAVVIGAVGWSAGAVGSLGGGVVVGGLARAVALPSGVAGFLPALVVAAVVGLAVVVLVSTATALREWHPAASGDASGSLPRWLLGPVVVAVVVGVLAVREAVRDVPLTAAVSAAIGLGLLAAAARAQRRRHAAGLAVVRPLVDAPLLCAGAISFAVAVAESALWRGVPRPGLIAVALSACGTALFAACRSVAAVHLAPTADPAITCVRRLLASALVRSQLSGIAVGLVLGVVAAMAHGVGRPIGVVAAVLAVAPLALVANRPLSRPGRWR